MSRDRNHDHDHEVDRIARAIHAEALARVPERTLMQLRARRTQAAVPARPRAHVLGWSVAAACMAVLAVAVGLNLDTRLPATASQPVLATAPVDATDTVYGDAYASLDEDPDFYLWLATTDVQPLAME